MLAAFSFRPCCNDRDGFWFRAWTMHEDTAGNLTRHISDLAPGLARRLADALCDRYGIEDRACLLSGKVFLLPSWRVAIATAQR